MSQAPLDQPQQPVPADISTAVAPLRMVFWGGLLVVLDLKINGFDLLNDTVGMILITIGVFHLASFKVDRLYRNLMVFAQIMSVIKLVTSFLNQLPADLRHFDVVLLLVQMLCLASTICFCVAMRRFCAAGLFGAANSWKTTTIFYVVIYAIPLGAFYLIAAGAILIGKSFNVNLGWAALPLLLVFILPLIHLFMSTSRMKRSAEEMPPSSPGPWGDHLP